MHPSQVVIVSSPPHRVLEAYERRVQPSVHVRPPTAHLPTVLRIQEGQWRTVRICT